MNRFIFGLAMLLAACSSPAPAPRPPLEGARIGGAFALTDQRGNSVTEKSFPGQYRLMYFGYTYCPDICPTDVANLARGLKAFAKAEPARARKVKFLFVSVDPARDTPAALKDFTAAFHPDMVGLTGSARAIEQVTKVYGVSVSIAPGQPRDSYLVDHSRAAYLMDPDNKPIALISQDGTADVIAAEIGKWVK
jgi:protein SCO1